MFEPFFTTKPPGAGTGLGPPMVYGLVKQHDGFVHLYSKVAQGTTVKIYLPLAPDQRLAALTPSRDEFLPGETESILLIEDEARLRKVAERCSGRLAIACSPRPTGSMASRFSGQPQ